MSYDARPWRAQAFPALGARPIRPSFDPDNPSDFDELVIGKWFHMEQMRVGLWWMRVGRYAIDVELRSDGRHGLWVEHQDTPGVLLDERISAGGLGCHHRIGGR